MDTPVRSILQPIRRLRWWICGVLFLSTVINYADRQTLSALAPYLKQDYRWTNFPVADGRSDTKSLFETPSPVPGLKAKSLTLVSVRRRPGGVLWLRYRVRK